ncbi:acyltransferase family protein [Serratia fonticola]|uniref:acyltransferase family protein n=1 Tax=Serratia fonticola TaxID=47917 RepID=UPI001C4936B9|nr:acyltransferase [Serratia fonticola]QXN65102.1 acyltransferase [Serratia fonticola]
MMIFAIDEVIAMASSKFNSIQALRGLAALAVMLFHFRWAINNASPGLGDKLFGWGAIGVDLFFIISGFVITLSASKLKPGIRSAVSFLKNRARRILPAYFFILLVTFVLSGAMSTFHYPEKVSNLISALTFTPMFDNNAPFYIEDNGFYGVRWTLNYEIIFYLVMALCLITKYRWLMLFGVFILSLVAAPLLTGQQLTLSVSGYQFGHPLLNLVTNPIILTFLMGVAFGLAYPHTQNISSKIRISILTLSIMLTGYCLLFTSLIGHGVMMSGWYLFILFAAIVLNDVIIAKYIPTSLVTLGEISFSLYLIHSLMNNGIGSRLEKMGVIDDGILRFVVSCAISIGLAYLSYRFIERPLSMRKQKPLRHETV